ncbi:MAG TPA: succinate dehydrogenase [Candidatus Desulfobacillus sp.]|nr:succinate dehydrogenase [Candidatus Desulfobacillus sp.]
MSGAAMQARLWRWQRWSAIVLAACVLLHIAGMILAVRGGLSAAEILARTRGNWLAGGFYAVFVAACAVHAPIGMMNIAREWWSWRAGLVAPLAALFAAALLALGLLAIAGLVLP